MGLIETIKFMGKVSILLLVILFVIAIFMIIIHYHKADKFCDEVFSGIKSYHNFNSNIEDDYIECCYDYYVNHLRQTSCKILKYER